MPIDLSPENQERVRAAAAENRARGGWGPPVGGPIILDDAEQVQEARVDYREVLHPRGRTGEWVKKPLTAARKAEAKAETVEPKDWTDPPPPVGKKGETKGGKGYSSDKAFGTNTALGHVGEDAFVRILGGTILHPEGKGAQSPLDVHYDGYAFEVKAVSTRSLAYKATPKPFEIEQKEAHAQELGVKAALAIVVIDSENGRAHAYYREGLKSGRLSKNTGWQYLGSTDLPSTKLTEADYSEALHPRGRTGRWVHILGQVKAIKPDELETVAGLTVFNLGGQYSARVGPENTRVHADDPEQMAHAIEGELQRREKIGQSLSHDDLDALMAQWFTPDFRGVRAAHPKTGYQIEVGKHYRVWHPDPHVDGPAVYKVLDYGDADSRKMFPEDIGTVPIKRVYRGVSTEEYEQALERGYIQSDKRGVISDWEGTNADTDPRSAVSYLPYGKQGRILQIDVRPEDEWFTRNEDGYLRTRAQIPWDRVSAISPVIFKDEHTGLYLQEADAGFERLHPRGRTGEFVRSLRHVIAIDGPAASGKSTVARAVAERMGGTYIDTGAHFRAAGLARTRGIDPVEALRTGRIRADGSTVTLDGEDVSDAIRTAAVDRAAADLGGVQEVRDAVQQAVTRRLDEGGLFVADGRDAGNALQAEDRIFLTADPAVRAERRAAARGLSVPEAHAAITERDTKDAPRIDAAMGAANHVIDNSNDTKAETVQRIVDAVSPKQATVGTSDFFDRQAEGEKASRIRPEFLDMALNRRHTRSENMETYQSGMGVLPRVPPGEGLYDALEFMAQRTGHGGERYPVEAYEEAQRRKLEYLLRPAASHVAVRVRASSLPAILDANQLVNVHDPSQTRFDDPEHAERHRSHRAEWEQKVWNIDATHPEDFPIYGYMAANGENVASGGASGFGDTKLRLREHVRPRSTVTYSDSNYIGVGDGTAIPAPVNRPEASAVAYNHDISQVDALTYNHGEEQNPPPPPPPEMARTLKRVERMEAEWRAQGDEPPKGARKMWEEQYDRWLRDQEDSGAWTRWKHGDFFETQTFGGIRFDQDVEAVTFTTDPDPEVTDALDALGIPWSVEGVQEAVFDRLKHPRGRTGLFVETPDPVKGVSTHEFVSALEGFTHGGLRLKGRTSRTYPPAGGEARFDVLTEGGEAVGVAGYTWQGDTVHFDRLKVQPSLQGTGFAGALMAHKLDAWKRLGFERVTVQAVDVGSYAWAKWGFLFKRNARAETDRIFREALTDGRWNDMREHVGDEVLSAMAQAVADGEFQSPADIAIWGREHTWERNGQTFWPGKAVLVGGRWRGVLPL